MKTHFIEPLESRIAPAAITVPTSIGVSDASTTDNTATKLTFTVHFDQPVPAGDQVAITFHTVDGTATSPTNFDAVTGGTPQFVTLDPNDPTSGTISVTLHGTTKYQPSESFGVVIDSAVLEDSGSNVLGPLSVSHGSATGTLSYPVPTVKLTAPASVAEGASANYIVTLSAVQDYDVQVTYSTLDGTAHAGSQYTGATGTVTIPAGHLTATIPVQTLKTTTAQDSGLTLQLQLSAPELELAQPVALGIDGQDTQSVAIQDTVNIASTGPVVAPLTGTTQMHFTVSLDGPATHDVIVAYHTVDGTASSTGTNPAYVAANSTVTIQAGQTSADIAVTINSENQYLPDHSFSVVLDSVDQASGASLGTSSQATGTLGYPLPTVSLTSPGTVAEGSDANFIVKLSSVQAYDVKIAYSTLDGTGVAGTQYTAKTGTITIPAGQATAVIPITSLKDPNDPGLTFQVQLDSANLEVTGQQAEELSLSIDGPNTQSVAIQDTVNISSGHVVAPLTGTAQAHFTVSLDGPMTHDVVVTYHTVDGTASSTGLNPAYLAANSTVTIPAGQTSVDIPITVNAESHYVANQSFTVVLDSVDQASGASLGTTTQGTGTISTVVSHFGIYAPGGQQGSYTINETAGTVTLTIVRTGDISNAATVTYNTADGTAHAGTDYNSTTGTLTFQAGVTQQTITVPISAFGHIGTSADFLVSLSSPTGGADVLSNAGSVDVTVLGNGHNPTLTISNPTVTVGAGGTTEVFTLTLDHPVPTGDYVTVHYSTSDGTATAGTDYNAISDTSVTFNAGETTKTVSVSIDGNSHYHADETFTLQATQVSVTDAVQTKTLVATTDPAITGTGTIKFTPPTVTIGQGPSVADAAGSASFTVTLSAAQNSDVWVYYKTIDGTAISGTDYTGANDHIVIPAGQTSATISVATLANRVAGPDETFQVQLTSASLQPSSGTNADIPLGSSGITSTATILDSANNVVSIAAPVSGTAHVNAGDSGKTLDFVVSLGGVATTDTVIHYKTIDGTAVSSGPYASYTGVTDQTVTIHKGESSATISVPVSSAAWEPTDESFQVQVVSVDGGATIGSNSQATGTIHIDGTAPADLTITNVSTDLATGLATITVHRSISVGAASVDYNTIDGSGIHGTDYTAKSGTLNFADGQSDLTITVPISNLHKTASQPDFSLQLSNSHNADLLDDSSQAALTISKSVTIPQNSVTYSIGSTTVNETDGTVTITVTRSDATGAATVNVSTADGTAVHGRDYTSVNTAVSFADGHSTATFTVPILDAHIINGSVNFLVTATDAHDSQATATGTVTINDNGNATLPTFAFGSGTATVEEVDGKLVLTVTRGGQGAQLAQTSTVHYSTVDGTAFGGQDYTAVSGNLIFGPGVKTQTIVIPITAGYHRAEDPTFTVQLSNPQNGQIDGNAMQTTVTINDSHYTTEPTISIGNAQYVKTGSNGNIVFTVKLSAADYTNAITVNYATVDQTAISIPTDLRSFIDFQAVASQLTLTPGQTTQTISIPVIGNDIVNSYATNPDEYFTVHLSGATAGSANPVPVTIARDTGTGTIVTNIKNSVSVSNATATEGDAETFTISLAHASATDLTFHYSTVDGTAKAGTNYTAVSDATITIPAGQTSTTVTVSTLDDGAATSAKTFNLQLTKDVTTPAGLSLTNSSATGTINDSHSASLPVFSIGNTQIVEGTDPNNPAMAVFTVTLSKPATGNETVHYTTVDGAADSSGDIGATSSGAHPDYVATSGTLQFKQGDTTATISVPVNGFAYQQANKLFSIQLSDAQNASIDSNGGTGQGTIETNGAVTSDGSHSIVGVSIADFQHVVATGSNNLNVTVTLSHTSDQPITFTATPRQLALAGPSVAKAGIDFKTAAITVTIPANTTTYTFPVPVLGEDSFHADRTFALDFTNFSSNAVALNTTNVDTILGAIGYRGNTVKWHDVDGDLVTLKVSKGTFYSGDSKLTFASGGTLGGVTLQELNLSGSGHMFAKANVSITSHKVSLFPGSTTVLGDGKVNVGYILANPYGANILDGTDAVDLGAVKVTGDLARIDAGDIYNDAGLASLNVQSLGVHTENLPIDNSGNSISPDSVIVGPVGSLHIAGDMGGAFTVFGQQYGTIGSLNIGGTLKGTIAFTGRLSSAVIGQIDGTGSNTGMLEGVSYGSIGSVKVLGSILGGSNSQSGSITAPSIGSVNVGSIVGGSGAESGIILGSNSIGSVLVRGSITGANVSSPQAITGGFGQTLGNLSSGEVVSFGSMGTIHVQGNIAGAGSESAGAIIAFGSGGIRSVIVDGSILGDAGIKSGNIESFGGIGTVTIAGLIVGGAGSDSGEVIAKGGNIGTMTLSGALQGGSGQSSGSIQAALQISQLQIGHAHAGYDLYNVDAIAGSSGTSSGTVSANSFGKVVLHGSLQGASGSGSGSITATGGITSAVIDGGIFGSTGANSGVLKAGGTLGSAQVGSASVMANRTSKNEVTLALVGGTGSGTGLITASTIKNVVVYGDVVGSDTSKTGGIQAGLSIGTARIAGNLTGGDSGGAAPASGPFTTMTGFVSAGTDIKSVEVDGNVTSGIDYGGGVTMSGAINAAGSIGSVLIKGDFKSGKLVATTDNPSDVPVNLFPVAASITAGGTVNGVAIGKVEIDGNIDGGKIIAGDSTSATGVEKKSADASIGKVILGTAGTSATSVSNLIIAAGAGAGPDGILGTSDDVVLSGGSNDFSAISKIASVIFLGDVKDSGSPAVPSVSVEAQEVDSVVAGAAVSLHKGPGNDPFPTSGTSGPVVFELPTT